MKLTAWSDIVKPQGRVLGLAGLTALATIAAVVVALAVTDRSRERMDRFGASTARVLAELAVEPLMEQNRLHLGVMGNRLADTPEVAGVASFTADNQLLAATGPLGRPQYTAPVTIDDSVVGYVRLALEPAAFRADLTALAVALALCALLVPPAVGVGVAVAGAARRGELKAALPGRPRWLGRFPEPAMAPPAAAAAAAEDEPEPLDPEPPPDVGHYLLAVNLYNQLSLAPAEREFELSLCTELAEAVAGVYQGQVVALPGRGVLVDLDDTDDSERPFQALCAAFTLARLLQDEAPFGRYRLGLHLTLRPADEPLALEDDAIADVALLSALARAMTVAVSEPFARALGDFQRVTTRPLVNPLLDQLTTSKAGCYLVTELAPPFASLVAQQAEQLKFQRDGTASPSTF